MREACIVRGKPRRWSRCIVVVFSMCVLSVPVHANEEDAKNNAPPPPPVTKPPSVDKPLPGPVGEGDVRLPDRLLGPSGGDVSPPTPGEPSPVYPVPESSTGTRPSYPVDLDRISPTGNTSQVDYPFVGGPLLGTDKTGTLNLWQQRRAGPLYRRSVAYPHPRDPFALHGSVRVRYRGRSTADGDEDHDLYQHLQLDWGNEFEPGFFASFNGRLHQDLDAIGSGNSFHPFRAITDSSDGAHHARVYHAYAGYRPSWGPIEEVRVGRQYVHAGDQFPMDGGHLVVRPVGRSRDLRVHVFGGKPTHLYERSLRGDYIVGAGIEGAPWQGARGKLDFVRIHDENDFYGSLYNNLVTADLRQAVGDHADLWARYQHLNGSPSFLDLAYNGHDVSTDFTVRARLRTLLTAQRALAFDLDPYFAITQSLEPYYEGSLSVAQGLGTYLYVEGGASGRWLRDDNREGRYNREFQRAFVALGSHDWPAPCWALTATGEAWFGDETIHTLGFEVEYKPSKLWRFRVGTDFQLFRTDVLRDEEHLESRSVYLDARWQPTRRWRFHVRARWEDDDFDTYLTLDAGVTLRF